MPVLQHINFSEIFDQTDMISVTAVIANFDNFPNLKFLEFKNVTFSFASNNELQSFILANGFSKSLILCPNLSYILLPETTEPK